MKYKIFAWFTDLLHLLLTIELDEGLYTYEYHEWE